MYVNIYHFLYVNHSSGPFFVRASNAYWLPRGWSAMLNTVFLEWKVFDVDSLFKACLYPISAR